MSEWFENFSDNIEENAGYYAAAGGMMHLRNQDAQKKELQKQRRILEQQARDAKDQAKTEKERLALENSMSRFLRECIICQNELSTKDYLQPNQTHQLR